MADAQISGERWAGGWSRCCRRGRSRRWRLRLRPRRRSSTGKPLEIPVDQIDRNPFQTRTGFDEAKLDELAASITASGRGAADHCACGSQTDATR